jgi:hypothetical protein
MSNVDRFPVVGDETRIEFRFSRFQDFVQTRARHRLRAEPAGRQDRRKAAGRKKPERIGGCQLLRKKRIGGFQLLRKKRIGGCQLLRNELEFRFF